MCCDSSKFGLEAKSSSKRSSKSYNSLCSLWCACNKRFLEPRFWNYEIVSAGQKRLVVVAGPSSSSPPPCQPRHTTSPPRVHASSLLPPASPRHLQACFLLNSSSPRHFSCPSPAHLPSACHSEPACLPYPEPESDMFGRHVTTKAQNEQSKRCR